MENQHRKIKGYRELTQGEIDLMNKIKEFGPQFKALATEINDMNTALKAELGLDFSESEPYRWTAIGCTDIQQGLMALTRAVAKPDFF